VLDLLAEAAEWMQSRGYENWPVRFPRSLIAGAVDRRELYMVEEKGDTVATLTLQWSDPRFWGDADADAGYVHRLAVRRARAGSGMGHRLLEWADEQVRARGRGWSRLDVVTGNRPLRAYYEAAGFVHVRDIEGQFAMRDGTRRSWQTSLYERACGSPKT
jgi:GNAT superfamily N-acetyltransferase